MLRDSIKRFCSHFKIELIFLIAASVMLSIVSQICSHVFLNTFHAKQKDYSLEVASIITSDINKLLKAVPKQKLNLDIIKNYKISSISGTDNKVYIGPDILKLVKDKKMIFIDLHYIKHLITRLYHNNIRLEFVDIKLHPQVLYDRKVLYQTPIVGNINLVAYSSNIHNELALKSRQITYLSSLAIVIILTSFYMMIRRLYLQKEASYKQCIKDLATKEKFRIEYKKLTQLLYKPVVSKLKSEIYHDMNQEFKPLAIFSVVNSGDSHINIPTFCNALSDLFYVIKFKFHTKVVDGNVRIGLNHASFCQIIYSFVNHIHNSLGDNQTVNFYSEIFDFNLVIRMEYVTSEFARVQTLHGKEELLHPFLIHSTDIFKILAQHEIYCQQTSVESQSTIEIKLPLKESSKDSVKVSNIWYLKDYRT